MIEKFLKLQNWFILFSIFFFMTPSRYIDIPFYFATLIFLIRLIKGDVNIPNEGKVYFIGWMVWTITAGVASLFSPDKAIAFHKWPNHFLWMFMPFVVMVTSKYNEKWLKRYLYGFLTLATIITFIMVYQGAILRVVRAGSIFGFNIGPCTTMVLMGSVIVEILFFEKRFTFINRKILAILFFLMVLAILYTRTRIALLGGGFAWSIIFLLYILKDRKNLKFLIALLFIVNVICVLNPRLVNRWNGWNNPNVIYSSNIARIHLWTAGWNMFKDHPIVGVGYDCFQKNFVGKYMFDEVTENEKKLESVHNQFVEAACETGIMGLFGYIFFLVCLFGYSWKQYRKYDDPFSLMIFGISITVVIEGLASVISGTSHVVKNYWLVIGLLALFSKNWKEQKLLEQNEKD